MDAMSLDFEPYFLLIKYTHFFKIYHPIPRVYELLMRYSKRYILNSLVRKPKKGYAYEPTHVFAARLKSNTEFRFPINALPDFISFLEDRALISSLYRIIEAPLYIPNEATLCLKAHWKPKDYQAPAIEYLLANDNNRSKFLGLRTGRGKTFCAISAIVTLNKRTVVLIKPIYIDKWKSDFIELLDIDPNRITTISGSKKLQLLILSAMSNLLEADVIIISNRTYQNYIEAYEHSLGNISTTGYGCAPENFFKTIGAGVLLMDEVHQEFFSLYRAMLYTHIPLSIGLSATLLNENPFLERMYALIYPKNKRYVEYSNINYLKVVGISYAFKDVNRIRIYEHGCTMYSHTAFEKSIMRQPIVLLHYMELIKYVVEIGYITGYKVGDKLIIFASSIALCTELTAYLKKCYPHFDVRRYVEDDPYSNVIDPDIRITTLLSAGTAVDIPGLRTSILTVNILSSQTNIQAPGRLRKLNGRDTLFYYLWCNQIPKHERYHRRRAETLADHVESIQLFDYPGLPL